MLILFDCDGVLVDSELIGNRVLASHLSAHGYPMTAAESQRTFIGMTIPKVIAAVRSEGVDLPDDFEATLRAKDEVAFQRELKPVAGVVEALHRLDDVPKAVASSGSRAKIAANLALTGLDRFFPDDRRFSAEMVRHPKPAPDLFLLASERCGERPDRTLVIEDTPLGIAAARAAGMRAIGFTGGSHAGPNLADVLRKAGAERVIGEMGELISLL